MEKILSFKTPFEKSHILNIYVCVYCNKSEGGGDFIKVSEGKKH